MDWSRVPQTHRFVPLGFEAGGGVWASDVGFSEGGGGGGGRLVVRRLVPLERDGVWGTLVAEAELGARARAGGP
eukprot:COSAG05_NODE_10327_length_571_cov_1.010593_1_plen_73_part_10